MTREPDDPVRRWASHTERLIREAQDRGEFDDLPLRGQPLPREDIAYAGEMANANRILRNHGAAPPWIEADKEVRRLIAERDTLKERGRTASAVVRPQYRRRLAQLVASVNVAVDRLNAEAPSHRQHRRHLSMERELAALDSVSDAGYDPRRG